MGHWVDSPQESAFRVPGASPWVPLAGQWTAAGQPFSQRRFQKRLEQHQRAPQYVHLFCLCFS